MGFIRRRRRRSVYNVVYDFYTVIIRQTPTEPKGEGGLKLARSCVDNLSQNVLCLA